MLGSFVAGGAFAAPVTLAVAEQGAAGFDPWTLIGTVITPVVVVVLLLIGKLHTDVDYKRLSDTAKSEHDERIRLQNIVNERVIPMSHRQTLVMEATLPLVQAQVRLLEARENASGGE